MLSTLDKALQFFGYDAQKIKVMEELAELMVAVAKNDRENIIEEIADVEIMIEQLKIFWHINKDTVDIIKSFKTIRLAEKIAEEKLA